MNGTVLADLYMKYTGINGTLWSFPEAIMLESYCRIAFLCASKIKVMKANLIQKQLDFKIVE